LLHFAEHLVARSYILETDFVLFDEVNKVISMAMDYSDATWWLRR
jgi:hypothetical protein